MKSLIAAAIRFAGYDGCSTASNHTLDAGTRGIGTTLDALDAQGLSHTGSARTRHESRTITRYQVGDAAVAHLAYSFGFNGLRPNRSWMANRIDPDTIVARAERARREGADLVIVSLHWGVEGERTITAEQRAVAQEITTSGQVDLIVGHHAHVLQPIAQINGVWVVFGLGNMISDLPDEPALAGRHPGRRRRRRRDHHRHRWSCRRRPPGRASDMGRPQRWLGRPPRATIARRRRSAGRAATGAGAEA